MIRTPPRAWLTLLAALAACEAGGPTAPRITPGSAVTVAALDCTLQVAARSLHCGTPAAPGDRSNLILGGQNEYVYLSNSIVRGPDPDGVVEFDVAVQNLIGQPLGTTDGLTRDPAGVRIFFHQDPVATEGVIAPVYVVNETGYDSFLREDQSYFQYDEVLPTNAISGSKTWQIHGDPGTTMVKFKVYVAAAVPNPAGWVDLTPRTDTMMAGGTEQLAATVRSVVGHPLAGQTVTWTTSDAAVATVNATGLVTGVAPGEATITAASGARRGTARIVVRSSLPASGPAGVRDGQRIAGASPNP